MTDMKQTTFKLVVEILFNILRLLLFGLCMFFFPGTNTEYNVNFSLFLPVFRRKLLHSTNILHFAGLKWKASNRHIANSSYHKKASADATQQVAQEAHAFL